MKYVVDSPAGERLTGVKELSPYLADYYTREGYTLTLYVRPLRIAAGVHDAVTAACTHPMQAGDDDHYDRQDSADAEAYAQARALMDSR